MVVELINTGDELLLGRVVNTHLAWLGTELARLGLPLARQVAVPDGAEDIRSAVATALGRSDLVLVTGGLGPTGDDRTRDEIARLLGRKLFSDTGLADRIRGYFAARGKEMPDSCLVQAQVPEGAVILDNDWGTAPGLAFHLDPNPMRGSGRAVLALLPGPPRELRPMFTQRLLGLLAQWGMARGVFVARTLRTVGWGESQLEERLAGPLAPVIAQGVELGFCARLGEVEVRLSASGPEALARVDAGAAIVRRELGEVVYGEGDDSLEGWVVARLTARGESLALAESCTGGLLSHRLTNVPGASRVFRAGYVAYANEVKQWALGVSPETLERHGAVSGPVAREMAEGCRRATGADYAVAVTGIAGPGGGTEAKPVGTVFLAVASARGTRVEARLNPMDRESFKFVTSQQALALLREEIHPAPGDSAP
ncbi:MAG: competence/damage-inducible protein A [Verrucomicrobiota bacterium]